jgi:TolB-like protein/tetratricopeptide (TPR) repeat protein
MKFWHDLRRRRVLRFTGLYIVGAWLVFQIADVFFPAWSVPEAALRYLFYAALACFPIALVFSWFYDVSTTGIVRTHPAGEEESIDLALKRTDYLVLAGLLVVAGAILFGSLDRVVKSAGEAPLTEAAKEKPPNSIAVLPFDNLDTRPDTGYFSNGVSEEILHRLASIRKLKVIGRTSSFAFGDTDMGLNQISDVLGVRYLLNGSIRRDGDQVRLTARLLDASGYQVWSESFDGELTGIFKFQAEIAEKVASEITRELVVLESPEPARTTTSPEAYRQYLIGREYFHDRPPNWKNQAAEAYRRSIAGDPEFAPPYAGLAIVTKMGADFEDPEAMWPYVNGLIEHALALDPLLAETWMARGLPHGLEPDLDIDRNIEYLGKALELNPNLATAYNWLNIALTWADRGEEAAGLLERGLEIDPLNPVLLLNYADEFLAGGDFTAWKEQMLSLLDLPDTPAMVYHILSKRHFEYGKLSEAAHWRKQSIRLHEKESEDDLVQLVFIYEQLGMQGVGDYWAGQLTRHTAQTANHELLKLNLLTLRGNPDVVELTREWLAAFGEDLNGPGSLPVDLTVPVLIAAGELAEGIALLEGMGELSEPLEPAAVGGDYDLFRLAHWLTYAYQQTGRVEDGAGMLARADRILEIINQSPYFKEYPDRLILPALSYAATGNLAEAATALRVAFEAGWRAYHFEVNSPLWRGAWTSAEFAPVVTDLLADIERQRNAVEAIEAEDDFRVEFESLVAENPH